MLKGFGIVDPGAQKTALAALVEAGVISGRRGRVNIAAEKVARARGALEEAFLWRCGNGDCRRTASREDAPTLPVQQASCAVCGGSKDDAALKRMAAAADAANMRRILVVGGTPAKRTEIAEKSPDGVEWRLLDGQKSRDDRYFRADRNWADVIVIWGSTLLDHRVSNHFAGRGDDRVITVERRGIAALADGVVQHLKARQTRPSSR